MSDAPKLIADFDNGEGKVRIPKEWREWDALTRADILSDWIYHLTTEYNDAVSNIFPQPKSL